MSLRISFKEGIFVSSNGELNYQDVIDDFENAKTIRIITYNLSKSSREDKLFEILMDLDEKIDIQLITNIPSRFNWYTTSNAGEYYRRTASSNIDAYLNKLDPGRFGSIKPFFNFSNHSKIIGTENIVYIGSANFSNESARNQETGILIKDKDFIKSLYETFFENIKEDSIPYFDNEFNKLRLTVASLLTRMINHYDYIIDEMFIYDSRDRLIFRYNEESGFLEEDLDYLIADLYELEELGTLIENIDIEEYNVEELVDEIYGIYEKIKYQEIKDLVDYYTPFYEYVTFSIEKYANKYIEEHSLEAYDEYLYDYVDSAMDEANDKLSELSDMASSDVILVKEKLEFVINKLSNINDLLAENSHKLVSKGIDNTK